jgi:aminopeptidase N
LAVLGWWFSAGWQAAAADPRIEAGSGRQVSNWARPLEWDVLHARVEIDIDDMESQRFSARQGLRLTPVGRPRSVIELDAVDLRIRGVRAAGRRAGFEHDGRRVRIELPARVAPGREVRLEFEYDWVGPKNESGDGMVWFKGDPKGKNATERAAQIHTQGQPESNRTWFIGHDFPNDRLTTEMIVTVEEPFTPVSNGRLMSQRRAEPGAGGRPRQTWRWLQDKPHPMYLVVLAVGDFAVIDVGGPGSARPGLPMRVWTEHGEEERTRSAYENTARMMAFFERLFDEPYPWDKYDQVVVRNFRWGGMENTSASIMNERASFSPGVEDLIAHELAHQWMGNLITCRSWEHLWLNEGWATFAEALWAEEKAGPDPEARRRAYQRRIVSLVRQQRAANRGVYPEQPPMVSNRYNDPDDNFTKPDDVYSKGALVLHMLRQRLGDEAFFRATRLYIDRFKFRQVETDDFRRVLEEVSGQSLERFFEQWAMRPGLPTLEFDLSWDDPARALTIAVEQTQTIDGLNPPYALSIPVYVRFEGGGELAGRWITLDTDAARARGRFTFEGLPGGARAAGVQIDPSITIAARSRIRTPLPEDPPAGADPEPDPSGGG